MENSLVSQRFERRHDHNGSPEYAQYDQIARVDSKGVYLGVEDAEYLFSPAEAGGLSKELAGNPPTISERQWMTMACGAPATFLAAPGWLRAIGNELPD